MAAKKEKPGKTGPKKKITFRLIDNFIPRTKIHGEEYEAMVKALDVVVKDLTPKNKKGALVDKRFKNRGKTYLEGQYPTHRYMFCKYPKNEAYVVLVRKQ